MRECKSGQGGGGRERSRGVPELEGGARLENKLLLAVPGVFVRHELLHGLLVEGTPGLSKERVPVGVRHQKKIWVTAETGGRLGDGPSIGREVGPHYTSFKA